MTIRLLLVIIFAGVLFTCRPQYLFAEEQTQSTYQAETSVSRLHANISKLAPNWMTTNDDPKFIEWAKSTREYKSGTAIIVLLNEAYERGDAGSVAAIFNDYDLKKQGSNSIELQQSALNKSQAAMYLYEKGDKKAALHDMEIAAGMGESLAQIWVAQAYFNGDGCEVNYEKAFKWYNEAAKQGDFFAQFNLGVFYNNGYFVKKDCKQAFYWYSKSALGSLPQAQYALGKMYDLGQCVDKNIKKAYEYWKMAADKGHTESQYSIATLYENGEYLQKDNVKALEWFLKAADSDHDKASLSAAVFYQTGKAGYIDLEKATKYYSKIIQKEDHLLINNIAKLFDDNIDTSNAKILAATYYRYALEKSTSKVNKTRYDNVLSKLNKNQVNIVESNFSKLNDKQISSDISSFLLMLLNKNKNGLIAEMLRTNDFTKIDEKNYPGIVCYAKNKNRITCLNMNRIELAADLGIYTIELITASENLRPMVSESKQIVRCADSLWVSQNLNMYSNAFHYRVIKNPDTAATATSYSSDLVAPLLRNLCNKYMP